MHSRVSSDDARNHSFQPSWKETPVSVFCRKCKTSHGLMRFRPGICFGKFRCFYFKRFPFYCQAFFGFPGGFSVLNKFRRRFCCFRQGPREAFGERFYVNRNATFSITPCRGRIVFPQVYVSHMKDQMSRPFLRNSTKHFIAFWKNIAYNEKNANFGQKR